VGLYLAGTFGEHRWKIAICRAHRDSQGCSGCTCIPQGEKKNLGRDLQEKVVSESKVGQKVKCLRTFLLGGGDLEGIEVVNFAVLACVLRTTNEKRASTFSRKKIALQRKFWLRLCTRTFIQRDFIISTILLMHWADDKLRFTTVYPLLLQVRQPGTRCQTISAIHRLAKTLLGDC